jgi:excinuclease ABC subunit B
MQKAIDETSRRRIKQMAFNKENNIDPETIFKTREEILRSTTFADSKTVEEETFGKPANFEMMSIEDQIAFMIQAMKRAAQDLEFETAIQIREEIKELKARMKPANKRRA